jgi:3D (Asp-Asp-Asp) domain-containing protein
VILSLIFSLFLNPHARRFVVTAYCFSGRTASGKSPRMGVISADTSIFPLGTILQISVAKYSGVYTVEDSGVHGNVIDIWLPSPAECKKFGRRRAIIQVLRYGKSTKHFRTKFPPPHY